jgi:hypothetical protein
MKTLVKREAKLAWRSVKPGFAAWAAEWRPRARNAWERIRSEMSAFTGRGSRIG